jgi:hypothetical protein
MSFEFRQTSERLPESLLLDIQTFLASRSYIDTINLQELSIFRDQQNNPYIVLNYMGACPLYSRNPAEGFVDCNFDDPSLTLADSTVGSKYIEFLDITNNLSKLAQRYGINLHLNICFADLGVMVNYDPSIIQGSLDRQFEFYRAYAASNLTNGASFTIDRYSTSGSEFPLQIYNDCTESFSEQTLENLFQSLRRVYPLYIGYRLAEGSSAQGSAFNQFISALKRAGLSDMSEIIRGFFDNLFQGEHLPNIGYDEFTRNMKAILGIKVEGQTADDLRLLKLGRMESLINVDESSLRTRFNTLVNLQAKIYAEIIMGSFPDVQFNKSDRDNLAALISVFGFEGTRNMIQLYQEFDHPNVPGQLYGYIERFSALLETVGKVTLPRGHSYPVMEVNLMRKTVES